MKGLLEPLLPDDWRDDARDVAHFLLHYLPEEASSKALPIHLHLLPETVSEYRKTKGFLSRSLVVVGHSFGGSSSCAFIAGLDTLIYSLRRIHAVVHFPALFSSVVLLDPVIVPNGPSYPPHLLVIAAARRNSWPSR
jgi:pimeloyl-ACP methyl ester carboxylesterase